MFVPWLMDQLETRIQASFDALSGRFIPTSDDGDFLYDVVKLACEAFNIFLIVHPYINGNGHMARFIIWCFLAQFGVFPVKWSIEPSPAIDPYVVRVRQYRAGDKEPLIIYILNCIE